jgi:hypothetical protein
MAKWHGLLGMVCLVVTGCQTAIQVQSRPAPNFHGPRIAAAEPALPHKVAAPPNERDRGTAVAPPAPGRTGWDIPIRSRHPWRYIVIHHSATKTGSAAVFDRIHRDQGWDELGYHFVIGNGTQSRNGMIEVGPRWPKQKHGAHAKTSDNRYNDFGIGICLVGNFEIDRPSPEQMKAAAELVAYLMKTYRIPPQNVVGHADTGKATDCPGRLLSVATIRLQGQRLAQAMPPEDDLMRAAAEFPAGGSAGSRRD